MKTLNLKLNEKSYPIYIGRDLLLQADFLSKHISGRQVMIVSNTKVAPLYLAKVEALLGGFSVKNVILPDGEKYKNLETLNLIFDALLAEKFDRTCTLIALGGGVIGDMTGFAAASYQRGVNFVQIPTTLLATVDSSVGGKTGVNHALGKNMIGAFHQPQCVLIDINTLDTLEARQYAAGMAEVIKYGLLGNAKFLQFLQQNMPALMARDKDLLAQAIYQSCADKAEIVATDELESGRRVLLNLGHTFGHALENTLGYGKLLHGEAIAIGMLMAAKLSMLEGHLSADEVAQVADLCKKADLPCEINSKIKITDFTKAMLVDKKSVAGKMRLILLKKLGQAFITNDYQPDNLHKIIEEFL
ncbi:MAG: 3-dehydroquinate synthase [Candidatus Thioglobus sp.]|nr:3-dehydroquinate synthase [Candidatus Thioglobus sp.]